jgi:hypothetical protein
MADLAFWDEVAKLAPIGTAAVALLAFIIAFLSLRSQSQTARRRATIDFFFKTEMDENIFKIYSDFRAALPNVVSIVSRPVLTHTDPDYLALIKWLNICEMLAMGVRSKAFSDPIAYQYWAMSSHTPTIKPSFSLDACAERRILTVVPGAFGTYRS